ncbi:family 10 glycosylhydrolase [Hymenobacter taeanensis]|uniref:Family 10 glycosylhydrolase n=1 Tax=Hymenobacter taeanensis TaxID=2735321 RepID=A0A6M6BCJ8_9BACT|nr:MULTISPECIES: family 10 glycosylhydrolase [Hymenobacter]QJX45650.1 family 10 glycosylhydrolase [Hymenobacter taeanensis]UOQ79486.1 family 10 glycosylhydrolase [Hymenobacter sp. 5414T-23]
MFRLLAPGRFPFLAFLILTWLLRSQLATAADTPPKRELRGVWIATVENIDWPSSRNLTPEQQRREYRRILDEHQRSGINAVFVQVRPASDAFYQSSLEPWSKWLTGTQGKAPTPLYDPLPFLIEEAHNRGMEFHAWFNPYRASMDSVTRRLAPNHPFRQHPEWFLRFGGKLLYNPGLPEVRNYITQVILDVVKRYDIDGVHFDDYFYPYPEAGLTIHDEQAFTQYNPHSLGLADWRRENVNELIHTLHDTIQSTKRWVKFGISPFGVWRNQTTDPNGSATKAFQGYDGLYADALEWLRQGWVDYVLPQLYWSSNFKVAQYPVLVEWWARNSNGRHLYIGHGAYRMLENTRADTTWRNPRELPRQVRLNRTFPTEVGGSVFFSSKSLLSNPLHTTDSLRQHEFRYPALVPAMPWLDGVPPRPAQSLTLTASAAANTLTWQPSPVAPDGDIAAYYVLYRFDSSTQPTPDDPRNILAVLRPQTGRGLFFADTTALRGVAYAYYLTAVDRLHNESAPVRVLSTGRPAEIVVAQAPAPTPTPPISTPPPAAPAPTVPARPVPAPRPTVSGNAPTKVKVKTKAKRKRGGFFDRLFGGR